MTKTNSVRALVNIEKYLTESMKIIFQFFYLYWPTDLGYFLINLYFFGQLQLRTQATSIRIKETTVNIKGLAKKPLDKFSFASVYIPIRIK